MKKRIATLLLVVLILAVSVTGLMGCGLFNTVTFEEVESNLNAAEYTVTVMSGKDYIESDKNPYPFLNEAELESYLYAVKGDDEIHVYYFRSIDIAENNYSFMSNSNLLGGQNNQIVYFATKQARKDAKV